MSRDVIIDRSVPGNVVRYDGVTATSHSLDVCRSPTFSLRAVRYVQLGVVFVVTRYDDPFNEWRKFSFVITTDGVKWMFHGYS